MANLKNFGLGVSTVIPIITIPPVLPVLRNQKRPKRREIRTRTAPSGLAPDSKNSYRPRARQISYFFSLFRRYLPDCASTFRRCAQSRFIWRHPSNFFWKNSLFREFSEVLGNAIRNRKPSRSPTLINRARRSNHASRSRRPIPASVAVY